MDFVAGPGFNYSAMSAAVGEGRGTGDKGQGTRDKGKGRDTRDAAVDPLACSQCLRPSVCLYLCESSNMQLCGRKVRQTEIETEKE